MHTRTIALQFLAITTAWFVPTNNNEESQMVTQEGANGSMAEPITLKYITFNMMDADQCAPKI